MRSYYSTWTFCTLLFTYQQVRLEITYLQTSELKRTVYFANISKIIVMLNCSEGEEQCHISRLRQTVKGAVNKGSGFDHLYVSQ